MEEVYATVKNGTAVVKDYIMVGKDEKDGLEKTMQDEQHPLIEEL